MNVDDKKIVKSDESHNASQQVDQSKRSFSKAGMVVPVIMTLTSKTALGSSYYCTISGMQSGNQSSHGVEQDCGVGFSPGGWRENATKTGNQDGNLKLWSKAGIVAFSIKKEGSGTSATKSVLYNENWYLTTDPTLSGSANWANIYRAINVPFGSPGTINATTFSSVFGGTDNRSLWDVLDEDSGSLKFHAVADYLNAKLNQATGQFNPVYQDITPAYIVSVFNDLTLTDAEKQAYFELIHH